MCPTRPTHSPGGTPAGELPPAGAPYWRNWLTRLLRHGLAGLLRRRRAWLLGKPASTAGRRTAARTEDRRGFVTNAPSSKRPGSDGTFTPSGQTSGTLSKEHHTAVRFRRIMHICDQKLQLAQLLGVALPVLGHLHVQVQVDLAAQQPLDLLARLGPDSRSRWPPRPMTIAFWLCCSTQMTACTSIRSRRPSRGTISSTETASERQLVPDPPRRLPGSSRPPRWSPVRRSAPRPGRAGGPPATA